MERIREALEAVEWGGRGDDDPQGDDEEAEDDWEDGVFGLAVDEEENIKDGRGPRNLGASSLFPEKGLAAVVTQEGSPDAIKPHSPQREDPFSSLKIPLLRSSSPPPIPLPSSHSPQQKQEYPGFSLQSPLTTTTTTTDDHDTHQNKNEDGSEAQIGDLEQMMLRLQAVKEMGADLPEAERKRAAKKAVRGVMRML